MMTHTIIALDLGATKCAAGVIAFDQTTGHLVCQETCAINLADTTSLRDLLQKIEARLPLPFSAADAVCVGAAGQYDGRNLNHVVGAYPYTMPFADIAAEQNWPPFAVIHDYETVMCASFTSYMWQPENILRLNDCTPDIYKRRIVLGLGTGLGLKDGILLPNGQFWLGKNEIGHIGITQPPHASSARLHQHEEFMRFLRDEQHRSTQPRPITFENILTGRGLINLHRFLYASQDNVTPEIVGNAMSNGQADKLLDLLGWYLGLFIGTVQLIFLPAGGIWITGGVAIKHLEIFSQPSLNEGIQDSPAFLAERSQYALGVMKNPHHALIGAGYYAVNKLLQPVTSLSSSLL